MEERRYAPCRAFLFWVKLRDRESYIIRICLRYNEVQMFYYYDSLHLFNGLWRLYCS